MMKTNLIKHENTTTTEWSNGKTSEYFIYPTISNYQDKDFLFRISSATIDKSNAVFTNFIGYTRYLAMLDSSLDITINNRNKKLLQHQIIKFHSEDDVISHSIGTDFNLMIKDDVKNSTIDITNGFYSFKDDFIIIFCLENCEIFIFEKKYTMSKYDCLVIENIDKENIDIISPKEIILAQINLAHSKLF